MVELVADRGYRGLTMRALSRTSEVSTRSFYSHYASAGDAFASTCEWLVGCAAERTAPALRGGDRPEQSVREGLRRLLGMIAENPSATRLVLVDSYAAELGVRERVQAAEREFELLLARALAAAPGGAPVSERLVQGMVAGVEFAARSRLLDGLAAELPALTDELSTWILSLREAGAAPLPGGSAARPPAAATDHLVAALRGEAGDERGRLLVVVTRLAAAGGYAGLTASRVRAEAGVSRRSFDAYFTGVEDCFLTAAEALASAAVTEAERLSNGAGGWRRSVERATLALCAEVARNRALARLALVEILTPGLEGLRRRQRLIRRIAAGLRAAAPGSRRPTALAAEASIAAVWQLMQAEVDAGRVAELPQLAPTLAYILTL